MKNTSIFGLDIGDDHNIAERMAYIDFKLRFTGMINRSDLRAMFGLAEASASKMMTKYAEFRPHNMHYNARLRVNEILRESFEPLLHLDAETALGMLANGFNKNKLYNTPELPYVRIGNQTKLDINNVEKITRALASGYAIKCVYYSSSSDNHDERTLLPLSIVFDGINWVFRAFYRKDDSGSGVFRNFNFSRACHVEELPTEIRRPEEELSKDREWNTQVPLLLVPHGRLSEKKKETVVADFGLTDEKLIITERAALLWYVFNLLGVDKRSDGVYKDELNSYKKEIEKSQSADNNVKPQQKYAHYNFRLTNKDMVDAVMQSLKPE